MTEQHPITPPPELRKLWAQQAQRMDPHDPVAWQEHVATQAARWGADQELEASCKALEDAWDQEDIVTINDFLHALRTARRPKPLSLKEQALAALNVIEDKMLGPTTEEKLIRKALEALPE